TLIPFQRDQIKSADPEGDSYSKLLKAQIKLYEASKKAVETTLPWALASGGAREGDTASALANIESAKAKYRKFITGYDDERGRHTGIDEHLSDIARRKDPNESGTEVIYGETQPFSLPRKIGLYTEEKARRAAQIDSAHAEINAVLERIDAMTGGRHGLLARRLPVAVPPGKAGVDLIQRLVDDKTLESLGEVLTQLGNEYKAKAGEVSLGGGDQSQVPSGTQPSPKLDDNQLIALLALETAKRLTPSTRQGPESSGAAYAVARFLYSDAVVGAARTNLEVRIPVAERFLQRAKDALQKAVADADTDAGYVRGGPAGGADSVVDRKIALYQELNGITREGVEFYGLKVDWSKESYKTVDRIGTYYDSTSRIYESSGEVSEAERDAILKMKEALRKTFQELEDNRRKLSGWMSQLNSPQESALKRVAEDVRAIQEKTRAV
ncbi:MAG: hypothetical protein AAB576_08775, partial [Elusimicrobiota bacterium]